MDKIIEKIVKSANTPKSKEVLWLDISGEKPVFKHFTNGKWEVAAGGGGSYEQTLPVKSEQTEGDYIINAEYNKWYFSDWRDYLETVTINLPEIDTSGIKGFCYTVFFCSENPSVTIVPASNNDAIIMQEDFELKGYSICEFNFISMGSYWFVTVTTFNSESNSGTIQLGDNSGGDNH